MTDDTPTCPHCGGQLQRLGTLGIAAIYRCRQCGGTVSGSQPPEEAS